MLKKALKWTGISLGGILILLAVVPFLFQDKIKEKIKEAINKSVDANVNFENASLSLIKNFPKASVSIDKFCIVNKAPFAGDTLVYSEEIKLSMGMGQIFNGENEPLNIDEVYTENTKLNIIFNKEGKGNFDIAKKEGKVEESKESKPLNLSIQNYQLDNFRFSFVDQKSNMKMVLDSVYHKGKGNFDKDVLDLETSTKAQLTFDMDKSNYMRNVKLDLNAVLGLDLKNSKYTFKQNKLLINQLPLEFDGFLQMFDNKQTYDLTFKTPSSDFKNFLGLIPEQYAGNLEGVETTGKFEVSGKVKGNLTETTIPTFAIDLGSSNASFHYKDLPKTVKNITIDTHIGNLTGNLNDTYVQINHFGFSIDQDVFLAKSDMRNLIENPQIQAELKGRINLANISQAYPVKLNKPLNGILKADIKTNFDMKSVETSQYQNIKNSGTLTLTGFNYAGPELAKPISIAIADLAFNPAKITLNKLQAKTGKSDINASGSLENFYPFILKNETLKASLNLASNYFNVADFMAPSTTTSTDGKKTTEEVKVPSFLDCTITAKAATAVYDNLNLKNVSGTLVVRDQAVALKGLKMDLFGGNVGMNGLVSTKGKIPTFDVDLGLNKADIPQLFTLMNTLKTIAPIGDIINGKMNSTIKLKGNLKQDMMPDTKSISGELIGSILSGSLNKSRSTLLSELDTKATFLDLKDVNLKDVKAALSFNNGKVSIKPVTLKHKDIGVQFSGSHGFDQNMNYDLKFDVPAKYLGTDINNLIAKLTPADAKKLENIPVNGTLTGSFKAPKFNTDVKQATTNLATQLVKMQKQKLINQGTSVLGNIISGGSQPKDSSKTNTPKQQVGGAIKDGLNGLFGKKKKE